MHILSTVVIDPFDFISAYRILYLLITHNQLRCMWTISLIFDAMVAIADIFNISPIAKAFPRKLHEMHTDNAKEILSKKNILCFCKVCPALIPFHPTDGQTLICTTAIRQ